MLSRRDFIQDSMAVVSLGLAVPSVFSQAVVAAARQYNQPKLAGKTLIVVQMAGGVDGINTIIPYRDPAYRVNRPTLGIREEDMLVVDERTAFHPSFGRMKELFEAGKVAAIEGVGYPNPNFSHFKAMDIWQSADPEGAARDGWLGRYFEGMTDSEGHPLMGLSYGNRRPDAFESRSLTLPSVASIESFGLQGAVDDRNPDLRRTSLLKLYDIYRPANTRFAALLDTTLDNAHDSSLLLQQASAAYQPAVTYPQSSLATGLRLLATLLTAPGGTPLRVGHVMIGGFDTHINQPNNLSRLLQQTSDAISAFWQDIEAHGRGDEVLIMTWSEFGRRVRENAQSGTDHGSSGPMFVIGNAVRGGFYGERPRLTDLVDGNLRYTTDFRSVYATVLERWLEAPADDILRARFPQVDFLEA